MMPELVPKLVRRIESPLECKEFGRPRIRSKELLLRSVDLIRKVVRAPDAQRCINELSSPDSHRLFRRVTRPLFIVDDERKYLRTRPCQERPWILRCMANRDVDHMDVTPSKSSAHQRHEIVEPLNGNEVLLKYVSRIRARTRFQYGDVVAGLVVAPCHGLSRKTDFIANAPNHIAKRPLGDDPEQEPFSPVCPLSRIQTVRSRTGTLV